MGCTNEECFKVKLEKGKSAFEKRLDTAKKKEAKAAQAAVKEVQAMILGPETAGILARALVSARDYYPAIEPSGVREFAYFPSTVVRVGDLLAIEPQNGRPFTRERALESLKSAEPDVVAEVADQLIVHALGGKLDG